MGFKVRGYTRDVPQEKVRDYSLFAIATEGTEREPDYFRLFDGIDRIKVDIIEPEISDEENAFWLNHTQSKYDKMNIKLKKTHYK